MAKTQSTSPSTNSGSGALPAGTDRSGRRVPSEGNYTYTQPSPRETHRITPSGSVPRSGH